MQKIIIKNFGPIKSAEIEISKIVVLIGEQASGKSTAAKLIYFFKTLKQELFVERFNLDQNSNEINEYIEESIIKSIQKRFYLFFEQIQSFSNFSISYFYSDKKSIKLEKSVTDSLVNVVFSDYFLEEISRTLYKYSNTKVKPTNNIQKLANKTFSQMIAIATKLFEEKRTSLYVPAGRNITVSYSYQFKFMFFANLSIKGENGTSSKWQGIGAPDNSSELELLKVFFTETLGLVDRFKGKGFSDLVKQKGLFDNVDDGVLNYAIQLIEKILKGKYINKGGSEEYISIDKENSIPIHSASSGQQESIRILQDLFLILLDKKDVFRVIEEPEAHLYPVAQKNIIELVSTAVNNTDSQIIITTHSPYILSVFNNLLYAKKVANMDNNVSKEIEEIIGSYAQLYIEDFRAYSLKNNTKTYIEGDLPYCKSIVNENTGLISQNYLDEVSEELGDDFDVLYDIHAKLLR